MGQRAINKKMSRKIRVGDMVTWGLKVESCPVLEVHADGVVVNGGERFPRLFVTWSGGDRGRGPGFAPIEKVEV